MSKHRCLPLLLFAVALLGGCSSVSDTRPEVVRTSERYLQQGVEAYGNSDYVSATDFFSKALAQYRSIDDLNGILYSRINLAETAMAAGSYAAVRHQLNEAERILVTLGNSEYQPRLQLLWAQSYWQEKKKEKALEAVQPLLPEFDAEQKPQQRLDALMLSAVMLRTDIAFADIGKDAETAKRWLQRLDFAFARTSDTTALHQARLRRFEAQWELHKGALEEAEESFAEALEAYREAAARPAIAATLSESAHVAMQRGQWPLAEDRLLRALFIRVWILDRIGSAATLDQLSNVYEAEGKSAAAAEAADWSRHIREGKATDWRELGHTYLQGPLSDSGR